MTAAAHVYLSAGGRLLCVASAQLPAGLWKEVAPVQEPEPEPEAVEDALARVLARSAELSGLEDPPVWEGSGRARERLVARVERDGEAFLLTPQERVEDDYGVSFKDGDAEALESIEAAAARILQAISG